MRHRLCRLIGLCGPMWNMPLTFTSDIGVILSKRERGLGTHMVSVGSSDLVDVHRVDGAFSVAAIFGHVRPQRCTSLVLGDMVRTGNTQPTIKAAVHYNETADVPIASLFARYSS